MSQATITGNVTREPEIRQTNNGKTMLVFSIADNYKIGEKEYTDYWDVIAWGDLGKHFQDVIKKGMNVTVTGKPDASGYKGNDDKIRVNRKIHAQAIGFLKFSSPPVEQPKAPDPLGDDDDPFFDA